VPRKSVLSRGPATGGGRKEDGFLERGGKKETRRSVPEENEHDGGKKP